MGSNTTAPVLAGGFNTSVGINNGSAGNHTLLHQHQVTPEEMRHSIIVFYTVLVVMLVAQGALFAWRRKHRRSYDLATLVGLWLIPAIVSFQLGFWRFLVVLAAYTGVTGYYLYRCCQGQLSKDLPHQVYRWFFWVFHASSALGLAGYVLLLMEALGSGPLLRAFMSPSTCLSVLWYGLYFGILTRDAAEVASDRMAVGLGQRRRLAVSLSCKHLFHSDCIRGWTIVGKKDTCPTCHEKVDLRKLYASRPWESTNMSWTQMLDLIRFFVVWNPVILTGLHFVFHWTGLEDSLDQPGFDPAQPWNGTAVGLNATANVTLG
ncbi:RING finger protein 121 [Auxenochlorella protothecoides]|uniref:RING finger protein 121 n=1 Tax=Auxenochlorella protothecoides TaxID=3075 RepID=A0A087SRC8_AUXPR|nr:RING finger protein 121 [Auxenochlorella protothecoides]KFM28282.1 RING finger protein 121 [Auxenochlorella protothecoides]